jgi:putative membrane protein
LRLLQRFGSRFGYQAKNLHATSTQPTGASINPRDSCSRSFFATPALAQSVPEKTGVNSTLGTSPSTKDFVTEAANSDMLEIESSKLVSAKADAKDKTFAEQMIKDHTATSAELKGLVSSGKVQANLPSVMDKAHGAKLDKLNSLNSAAFIKAYEDMQVSAHKDAVPLLRLMPTARRCGQRRT